jgi:hypothetical protein
MNRYLAALVLIACCPALLCGQSSDPGRGGALIPGPARTRLAFVDGARLAEEGFRLEKGGSTEAALREFAAGLGVEVFDLEQVLGVVFVADDSADITEAFLKALRARPKVGVPLKVPALSVPAVTVALIDSNAFADPEAGIKSLVAVFKSIEREFKPRRDEILKLRDEAARAEGDRKRELEAEFRRKQAAGQAALERRVKEAATPVYEKIGKALTPFCKRHGISVLFDTGRMKQPHTLPPFGLPLPEDAPDVTAAFISDYEGGP